MTCKYYWIDYNGSKEIAVFLPEMIEDISTGEQVFGMWRLASHPEEVLFSSEIRVLSSPLTPPV
ncbi:hypothetical protein ACH7BS_24560 [Klebsiella aerogenes]|uniref:hypothetical protein n=1 Tax=Klebsiella aerogenes TaxID=548 RepID=UPI0037AFE677